MGEEPDAPDEAPEELYKVPSISDEELKQFVRDFVAGRIFSLHHISEQHIDLFPSIFMVVALGGLEDVDRSTIGTIYEYIKEAGTLGINGYPTFATMRMINAEDWERAKIAIEAATAALDNIEV